MKTATPCDPHIPLGVLYASPSCGPIGTLLASRANVEAMPPLMPPMLRETGRASGPMLCCPIPYPVSGDQVPRNRANDSTITCKSRKYRTVTSLKVIIIVIGITFLSKVTTTDVDFDK